MIQGIDPWGHDPTAAEDEDEEEDIVYDDDEDEFGLPSLTSMRRTQNQNTGSHPLKTVDPGGGIRNNVTMLGVGSAHNRQRANSSDIAEERGVSMYPTTRKGEGKILRPQYKDVLKGNSIC